MQIHIISLNVPYPANYGGVIDVFYKIKSLHEAGVQIHLHCFDYGRGNQPELEKYCNNELSKQGLEELKSILKLLNSAEASAKHNFSLNKEDNIKKAVEGEKLGTLIS